MIKYVCDLCKREIERRDVFELKVKAIDKEDRPRGIRDREICPWCKGAIEKFLETLCRK